MAKPSGIRVDPKNNPGQAGTTPGLAGTSPGQAGNTPGAGEGIPGQTSAAPGQTGAVPGDGAISGESITGTKDADVLIGTDLDDRIRAQAGDDTIDGGAGSDVVDGGAGNDTAIYTYGENVHANDIYDGGVDADTLELRFTKDEWLALNPKLQDDLTAYLAFLAGQVDPSTGEADRTAFTFTSIGLTASSFENLRVLVDGVEINPADEAVIANDDVVSTDEDVGSITGNVLDNDDAPDFVREVRLIQGIEPGMGTLSLDDEGNFSYSTDGHFNHLAVGETAVISFVYEVEDADGDTARSTVTLTIEGRNDGPSVAAVITAGASEDDAPFSVDLLAGASDPDTSDELNVAGLELSSGDASGVTVSNDGSRLSVNSGAYNHLAVGETETIVYTYTIEDGNGGVVDQTATITIEGRNDGPAVSAAIAASATEDVSSFTVDLLAGASDPDTSDELNVAGLVLSSGDASGVTVSNDGNRLSVNSGAYNHLAVGETETIVYTYTIEDGNGGVVDQTATITIEGANDGPAVSAAIAASATEDDSSFTVDLLAGASDPDTSDELNVVGLTLASGDASGVTTNGNSLTLDPNAYNRLAVGETETIVYTYTIEDGNGGVVDQTATITIEGANDAPTVVAAIAASRSEDAASFTVDLLAGASDADATDAMSVAGLARVAGDDSGITVSGGTLSVDPNAYNHLAVGEAETVIYDYTIEDGHGGSVAQSATITIRGRNDAPSVGAEIVAGATEDDSSFTVDLLAGASDPDRSDALSVAALVLVSGNASGVTLAPDGNSLDIDTGAYNALAAGETETIVYSYVIDDGNRGRVPQSATITIEGRNDGPVVTAAITATANEDDTPHVLDLLAGASDPDASDALNVANLSLVSGNASGVTVSGSALSVDPGAYNHLAVGETETIVYDYTVEDGNGVSVAQRATITITGANDEPAVAAAITASRNENADPFTVDLLAGATDADATDELNVTGLAVASGDASGVTVSGSVLRVDPGAYNHLAVGETETIVYDYTIEDGNGGSAAQSATIRINGRNDGAVVAGVSTTANEDADAYGLDLLAGSSDADASDVLSASNVTHVSGDATGVTANGDGTLSIAPEAYEYLGARESAQIAYVYDVVESDKLGNTLSTTQATATITIEGRNDAPTVAAVIAAGGSEDDEPFTVDLLAGANDADASDTLRVANLTLTSGDASGIAVSSDGGSLDVDPSSYNALALGASEIVTYSYDLIDGNGGRVGQTATITITGVNDDPETTTSIDDLVVAPGSAFAFAVPAGTFTDIDGDALTLSASLGDGSALPEWLSFDGTTFTGTAPVVGAVSVSVLASDGISGSVPAEAGFDIRVRAMPEVLAASFDRQYDNIANQTAVVITLEFDAEITGSRFDGLSLGLNPTAGTGFQGSPVAITSASIGTNGTSLVLGASVVGRVNEGAEFKVGYDGSGDIQDLAGLALGAVELYLGGDARSIINLSGYESTNTQLLYGNRGNDALTGSDGNDALYGGDGNDVLNGGLGADALTGGAGDDTYHVDSAADWIVEVADQGTDTVVASYDYTLRGSLENLTLVGAASTGTGSSGNNVLRANDLVASALYGMGGADTLYGGSLNDSLDGGGGADIIYGEDGNDTLYGGRGWDTLDGGSGNDTLYGDQGNDTLYGGDGRDTLDGGAGRDTMDGGAGNDTYYVDNASDEVIEVAGGGNDTVIASIDWTLAEGGNVENLTLTGSASTATGDSGANVLRASATVTGALWGMGGNDTLYGGSGDDTLDGGTGADTMDGGLGNDSYYVDNLKDRIVEASGEGNDSVFVSVDAYTLSAGAEVEQVYLTGAAYAVTGNDHGTRLVAHAVSGNNPSLWKGSELTGGSGADTLIGDGGADTLIGNDGDDVLDGRGGRDAMAGGAGDDTYYVDSMGDVVTETSGGGTDTVIASIDFTLPDNVENLTLTGGARSGTGNSLANELTANRTRASNLFGEDGNDTLVGGNQNDVLDGGDGADTLSGGDGDDTLNGGNAKDKLYGDAGNDTLDGGAGADTMEGGAGNDRYYVDNLNDTIVEASNEGNSDSVYVSVDDYVLNADAHVETLYLRDDATRATGNDHRMELVANMGRSSTLIGGSEADRLIGGFRSDTLIGNGGDDVLNGGAGSDSMAGGAGDDTYYVDSTGDVVTETPGGGTDTVISTVVGPGGYTLAAQVENLRLEGQAQIGVGNDLDNVLVANQTEASRLYGEGGNDTLLGGRNNDLLDGGSGDDVLSGGGGNDTYYVDSTGDVVTENSGGGTDTVIASIDFTLPDNVENLTLTGGARSGTGNSLANVMVGGSANEMLSGEGGDDALDGGSGADTLSGGDGDDSLSGGDGDDALYGDEGNDTLDGGAGRDTMAGGAGDDTYYVDNRNDRIVEASGEGNDSVYVSVDAYTLSAGAEVEQVYLTGAAYAVTGNDHGTRLVAHAVSGDNPSLWKGSELTGGSGADTLIGDGGNDTLIGNDGDDVLDGRGGRDAMAGGAGDDTYYVDSMGDVVTETSGGGTDTVISTVVGPGGYTLAAQVENLRLEGQAQIGVGNGMANVLTANQTAKSQLYGEGGNDTLYGGNGKDTLSGGDGRDTLYGDKGDDELYGDDDDDTLDGGAGNDRLEGGRGSDTLTGGAGGDLFVFSNGSGNDTVTDFGGASEGDLIDVREFGFASWSSFKNAAENIGSDVRIALDGNDSLTLTGLNKADLNRDDFLLASRAPLTVIDTASTTESTAVTVDVLANDSDPDSGDTFSLTSVQRVFGLGTATISNGQLHYDPGTSYEHLAAGQANEVIVEYTVTDNWGASSTGAAFITVTGQNDAAEVTSTLSGFGSIQYDDVTNWHRTLLTETGRATTLDFGAAQSAYNNWEGKSWTMSFDDQSLFGLGADGYYSEGETASVGFGSKTTPVTLVDTWILDTYAAIFPKFSLSFTPYIDVKGGWVDASHGTNIALGTSSVDANDYTQLSFSNSAGTSSSVSIDMPDEYAFGINGNLEAYLRLVLESAPSLWDGTDEVLIDYDEDFNLIEFALDTQEGTAALSSFGYSVSSSGLSTSKFDLNVYDDSDAEVSSGASGSTASTQTLQNLLGVSIDIDDTMAYFLGAIADIYGPDPRRSGFENYDRGDTTTTDPTKYDKYFKLYQLFDKLDYDKTFGNPLGIEVSGGWTLAAADLNLDLAVDVDSETSATVKVDLLFDAPVLVEGHNDPVMAIRNANLGNLPGIRSESGERVNVLPLFSRELSYSSDLSLDLLGSIDLKIGDFYANIDAGALGELDTRDYTGGILPLYDEELPLFDLNLANLGSIDYGMSGFDQIAGDVFWIT